MPDWISPCQPVPAVSQGFHPPGHNGIDLAVWTGTPILAPADGVISLAHPFNDNDAGIHLNIDHGTVQSREFHLSELCVSLGQQVTQGQLIALSGNTGLSTGPHLHYELRAWPSLNPFDPTSTLNEWTPVPPTPPAPTEDDLMALDYVLETPDGTQRILLSQDYAEGYPAERVTVPAGVLLVKAINQNEVDTAVKRRQRP